MIFRAHQTSGAQKSRQRSVLTFHLYKKGRLKHRSTSFHDHLCPLPADHPADTIGPPRDPRDTLTILIPNNSLIFTGDHAKLPTCPSSLPHLTYFLLPQRHTPHLQAAWRLRWILPTRTSNWCKNTDPMDTDQML